MDTGHQHVRVLGRVITRLSDRHCCTSGTNLIALLVFARREPPFNAPTPIGTYRLIVAGSYEFPAGIDDSARDIIQKILTPDPANRFGCLEGGVDDVMKHPFFKDIDFAALARREIKPPYTPEVEDDEDISNFEEPDDQDDGMDTSGIVIDQKDFEGW